MDKAQEAIVNEHFDKNPLKARKHLFKWTIFLVFMIFTWSKAQIVNVTFENFMPDSNDSRLVSFYLLTDDLNYGGKLRDASGSNNLTANGAGLGDSVNVNQAVVLKGKSVIYFDKTVPQYFNDNSFSGFNSNSGTIFAVYSNAQNTSGNDCGFSLNAGSSNSIEVYRVAASFNTLRYRAGGTNEQYNYQYGPALNQQHVYAINWNVSADTVEHWVDGALKQQNSSLGTWAGTPNLGIGAQPAGGIPLLGFVDFVAIYDTMLSAQEMAEICFLPKEWYSKNGGVTRDLINHPWAQGIVADSVYLPIDTTGVFAGRVDAWGASGGETLTVFNKAGNSQSFELTTDSTRYTISSITFAANDSIYFSAGAGETLYIDNVYLATPPPAASANIYANQFSGFPEYPTFENDEVIQ